MTDVQLKLFVAVAECGSFSKAEHELFLSKQALKKQVDSLEREIGARLLIRGSKGVSLTAAGKEFFVGARRILALISKETEQCRSVAVTETLNIAASQDSTDTFVAVTIPVFSKKYPEYRICHVPVDTQNWLNAVREGVLSLCLYAESPELEKLGLCYSQIKYEQAYCLMDKTNPLSQKHRIAISDLIDQRIYIGNRYWYTDILNFFNENNADIELKEMQSSYSSIVKTCTAGGICLFNEWRVKHFDQLIACPLDINAGFSLGIIHRRNPSQAVLKFIEVAKEMYGDMNTWTVT